MNSTVCTFFLFSFLRTACAKKRGSFSCACEASCGFAGLISVGGRSAIQSSTSCRLRPLSPFDKFNVKDYDLDGFEGTASKLIVLFMTFCSSVARG